MSFVSCPVACPLVWSYRGGICCPGAAFWPDLPANVLLPGRVSPYDFVFGGSGDVGVPSVGVCGPVGVVGLFSVAPPLAWSTSPAVSSPPTSAVPAKEKKKEERKPQPATGGGA